MKVVMSAENSQKKIQVALGIPADMDRAEMARECLRREAGKYRPGDRQQRCRAGEGDYSDRRSSRSLRVAAAQASRDGRRALHRYVERCQGSQQRGLQLLLSSHGGQGSQPHRFPDDAATYVAHLSRLRGGGRRVSGGDGDRPPPGLSDGRLLRRAIRDQRIRYHRRLPAGAAAARHRRRPGANDCLSRRTRRSSSKARCYPASAWSKGRSAK